ncbi:hypothetical protein C8Q75DRAFT_802981 [Abortiporus biennis]|nr:hypothetical protein C8Q75DRAFT_802981 [Abortiporus biennis]
MSITNNNPIPVAGLQNSPSPESVYFSSSTASAERMTTEGSRSTAGKDDIETSDHASMKRHNPFAFSHILNDAKSHDEFREYLTTPPRHRHPVWKYSPDVSITPRPSSLAQSQIQRLHPVWKYTPGPKPTRRHSTPVISSFEFLWDTVYGEDTSLIDLSPRCCVSVAIDWNDAEHGLEGVGSYTLPGIESFLGGQFSKYPLNSGEGLGLGFIVSVEMKNAL